MFYLLCKQRYSRRLGSALGDVRMATQIAEKDQFEGHLVVVKAVSGDIYWPNFLSNHLVNSLGSSKVFKLFLWMIVWMLVNQFLQMDSNWEWLAPCGFTTGIQSMYYIHLQNWGIIPIPWGKWRPRPHLNSMVKHGETLCLMVNACGCMWFSSFWICLVSCVEKCCEPKLIIQLNKSRWPIGIEIKFRGQSNNMYSMCSF